MSPTTDSAATPRSGDRLFVAAAVLLSILGVAVVFVVPYIPSNDGPSHILTAWWWNHLDTPGQIWSDVVRLTWPRSGVGFILPFLGLEPLVGWRVATQILLAATALMHGWGVIALGRAVQGRWVWPTLMGFPAAFSWSVYMGFYNFTAATAVSLWVLVAVVRAKQVGGRQVFWLLPALGLVAWLHMFAALAIGAVLGVILLAQPGRWRALGWLAVASIPVWVIVAMTSGGAVNGGWIALSDNLPGYHALSRIEIFAATILPGPWWRSELLVAAALVGAVLGVRAGGLLRAVGAAGLLSIVAVLVLPFNFPGWQGFAPRFGPIGIAAALAAWPAGSLAAMGRAAPSLLAAWAVVGVGWVGAFHVRLAEQYVTVLEGIGAPAPTNGFRVFVQLAPVVSDEATGRADVPFARFALHASALYALQQGGIGRVFHSMSTMAVSILAPASRRFVETVTSYGIRYAELVEKIDAGEASDDERREAATLERHLVQVISSYDDAILFGPPAARRRLEARGMAVSFSGAHVSLVRPVGCAVTFELGEPSRAPLQAVARIAAGPEPILVFRDDIRFALPAGRPEFTMTQVPCLDDVSVEVTLTDGTAAGSSLECRFRGPVGAAGSRAGCEAAQREAQP